MPPQPPPQVDKNPPELVASRDIAAGELVLAPMSLNLSVDKCKSATANPYDMTTGTLKGQTVVTMISLNYGFEAKGDKYHVTVKACTTLTGDNPTAFPFWFATAYKNVNVVPTCEVTVRRVAIPSGSVSVPVITNVKDGDDDDGGGDGGDDGDEDIAKGDIITISAAVTAEVGGTGGGRGGGGGGGGGRGDEGGGGGGEKAVEADSRGGARGGGDGGRGGDRGRGGSGGGRGRGGSTPAAKRPRKK